MGKDKKIIFYIKTTHQIKSGVNQNEKLNIFLQLKKKKKWENANIENIKFIIYNGFSSFFCLYNSGTVKGFANQYTVISRLQDAPF